MSQVKSRLEGVEYVFLDEVSILSARDMYKISYQLSCVLNIYDKPFGGMNMVFAGDFAQLPPAMGGENISLYGRFIGARASNKKSQEESIGKALWHQVTTVVVLCQNMRQQKQSEEDNKICTALENMRYKSCTLEDIIFYAVVSHLNFPIDHVSLMKISVMYPLLLLKIFIKMKSIVLVLYVLLKKQDKH